jgi:hypothetical protein
MRTSSGRLVDGGLRTHRPGVLETDGDPSAAQQLWQRYFQRLVGLARQKLRDVPRRVVRQLLP